MYLDQLSERAAEQVAAAQLLEDCWHREPRPATHAPDAAELRWFHALLQRDPVHQALASAGRNDERALHELALEIERQIPIVTGIGERLPAPHRLYVALQLAKVVRARPPSTLGLLRSIVVYADAGRLRKLAREAGVAQVRGRNAVVSQLLRIDAIWRMLDPYIARVDHRRAPTYRKAAHRAEPLRAQLRSWTEQLQAGPCADQGEQLAAFATRLGTEIRPILDALAHALIDQLGVTADLIRRLCDEATTTITLTTAAIALGRQQAGLANEASIHVSWTAQFQGLRGPRGNLLVHELAHVLDFEDGGLDGAASPCDPRASSADLRAAWTAAFLEAPKEHAALIDPYGFENRWEFFAVCTEHYFRDAGSLQAHAPVVFDLLHQTYGYVPPSHPAASTFATYWTVLCSRLRIF
ncbi:MAG: zinc-dependent peptidase [Proteobacteria bacterium]|nr:zinc-dependent peptidase [Pseudomonadota bacterium]